MKINLSDFYTTVEDNADDIKQETVKIIKNEASEDPIVTQILEETVSSADSMISYTSINYSQSYGNGERLAHVSFSVDNSTSMLHNRELMVDIYNNEFLSALSESALHSEYMKRNGNNDNLPSPILSSCSFFNTRNVPIHGPIPYNKLPQMSIKDYVPYGATNILDAIKEQIAGLMAASLNAQADGFRTQSGAILFTDGFQSPNVTDTTEDEVRILLEETCFNKKLCSTFGFVIICTDEEGLALFERLGFIKDKNLYYIVEDEKSPNFQQQIRHAIRLASEAVSHAVSAKVTSNHEPRERVLL